MDSQPNVPVPVAPRKGRLWTGIFLIGLGLLFLLGEFGALDLRPVGRYWPLVLLAIGAFRLAASQGRERWGGFWIFVAGIYCSIGVWGLFGLSWQTAWPIFLIAAGVSVILRPGRGGRERV